MLSAEKHAEIVKYIVMTIPLYVHIMHLLRLDQIILILIKKNLVNTENVIIDSKSGYSGAGRGVHKKYKDKNLYESLSSYGVGFHRHNSEIQQEIDKHSKKKFTFTFTPHLTPMFRGILSTIYIELDNDATQTKIIKRLQLRK